MKIDEAIKILASDLIPNYPYAIGPKARAIGLAIESLKAYQRLRKFGYFKGFGLLPGETEDGS